MNHSNQNEINNFYLPFQKFGGSVVSLNELKNRADLLIIFGDIKEDTLKTFLDFLRWDKRKISNKIFCVAFKGKKNFLNTIIAKDISSFINGNTEALNTYIDQNAKSEYAMQALWKQIRHYNTNNDIERLINTYNKSFYLFPYDPSFLNSYAWRMSELEYNLEDALLKVRLAVKLSENNNCCNL